MNFDFLYAHYGDVPARQRQWHIDHNIPHLVMCKVCNTNTVKWNIKDKCYRTYCSSKCAHSDEEVRKKTEATCLERYGATTNLLNADNIAKQKETCLSKYGVTNPFSSPEIIKKIRTTNLKKFGSEHATQNPDIKKKIDDTNFKKYGRKRESQSHLTSDIIDLKNDIDTMREWYYDLKIPVYAIAEILGVNHSQLCVHFRNVLGIDITRHIVSYPETQLYNFVRSICPDAISNDRTLISPKEIDIVIPSKRIAIEYDGLAWHSENRGRKNKQYHLTKTTMANQAGYHLIHVFSSEWETNPELVKSRIMSKIGNLPSLYARKCTVQEIKHSEAREFLTKTHIQGWAQSKINIGLYHDAVLVSVMTFGKPRFNQNCEWELIRLSSDLNCRVVGGAAKMFKFFVDNYQANNIISYCDLRWNTGSVYEKLGFTKTGITDPNFWIISRNRYLHHRTQFQKHLLEKKLSTYDPSLTAWDNLKANGYDRIWDCGNSVWVWNSGGR